MTDYNEVANYFTKATANLGKSSDGYKAFGSFVGAVLKDGTALDRKTKVMIALALAISARCDACIAHHIKECIRVGVSREEVIDIINVCILMGGGPSSMYGASTLEAYDTFKK